MVFQASFALCILGPAASDIALLAPKRDAVRIAVLESMVGTLIKSPLRRWKVGGWVVRCSFRVIRFGVKCSF